MIDMKRQEDNEDLIVKDQDIAFKSDIIHKLIKLRDFLLVVFFYKVWINGVKYNTEIYSTFININILQLFIYKYVILLSLQFYYSLLVFFSFSFSIKWSSTEPLADSLVSAWSFCRYFQNSKSSYVKHFYITL